MSTSTTQLGKRFLFFLELAPGISLANAWSMAFAAYTTIGMLTFVAIGTPFVLNANLGIPVEDQGRITGDLQFLNEIVLLLVFAPAGILADRIGRRGVYTFGMVSMGIAYYLFPLATSVPELGFYRAIYAIGIGLATGMLGTLIPDYSQKHCRGKMVAFVGILNGLGVVTMNFTLGRLPQLLSESGIDPALAGQYAFWVAAAVCAVSALVVGFGLKAGPPVSKEERLPIKELMVAGLQEARKPRIALAYASAFIARSDLVVLGTFTTLWGQVAGIEAGMDPARAAAQAGRLFGTASLAALIWLPIMGALFDRLNRLTGVSVCMALAVIGYVGTLFVEDALSVRALPWFCLLGVGQISAFLGATTLIAYEAPTASRGAVIGMFNMAGAVGILFSVTLGGRLFDAVSPQAPFILIGVLTVFVLIMAIVVRIKSPDDTPAESLAP